jgi:hypothetical protein
VAHVVTRAQRQARGHMQWAGSTATRCMQVRGHNKVACDSKAQGDMGARQCHHVLPSPRVIAVIMPLLSVVGPWWLLRERVCLLARRPIERGTWAAKEEVSKEKSKEKSYQQTSRGEPAYGTEATQQMLRNLAEKKLLLGTNKAQLNLTQHMNS